MTEEHVALTELLAEHRAGGYFQARDGHRECYCGHVMAADESYEAHIAAVIAAYLAPATAELDEARAVGERVRALWGGGDRPPVFLSDRPNKIVRVSARCSDLGATVTESFLRVSDVLAALVPLADSRGDMTGDAHDHPPCCGPDCQGSVCWDCRGTGHPHAPAVSRPTTPLCGLGEPHDDHQTSQGWCGGVGPGDLPGRVTEILDRFRRHDQHCAIRDAVDAACSCWRGELERALVESSEHTTNIDKGEEE